MKALITPHCVSRRHAAAHFTQASASPHAKLLPPSLYRHTANHACPHMGCRLAFHLECTLPFTSCLLLKDIRHPLPLVMVFFLVLFVFEKGVHDEESSMAIWCALWWHGRLSRAKGLKKDNATVFRPLRFLQMFFVQGSLHFLCLLLLVRVVVAAFSFLFAFGLSHMGFCGSAALLVSPSRLISWAPMDVAIQVWRCGCWCC